MDLAQLAPYIAGPASAVFVLLIVLYAIYSLVNKHLGPFLKEATGSIRQGFKDIAQEMKEDRKEHRNDMMQIMQRVDSIEDEIKDIRHGLSGIVERLDKSVELASRDNRFSARTVGAEPTLPIT